MWLNGNKVHFFRILSTSAVAVSNYNNDNCQCDHPKGQKENKTKIALNGSQTLHFVKGTRTYGKGDAFSRFFRSWQDEEAMEIKK